MHCEPTNSRLKRCFAQNIYMDRGWQNKTTKNKNIQHRGFAGGHPPNYWFGSHEFDEGRADGIPYCLADMVVCGG